MVVKVTVSRRTPAPSIPALVDDAFVKHVLTRVTDVYKARHYPTTPADVESELKKTFQGVASKAFGPEYVWWKDPATCAYHLLCIDGAEIAVPDGGNDSVIVRIWNEIVVV
jgi:hypothetical protein